MKIFKLILKLILTCQESYDIMPLSNIKGEKNGRS